ncbi:MAG: XdhC family protein, partial [Dehalococcoidia bacterium]
VGAKLLIREDGTTLGTLGSPELDQTALGPAREAMSFGRKNFLPAPGGSEIYIEAFASPPTIVVAGAGHMALAIYKLAKFLGFRIAIVDDRPEFANRERFPEAEEIVAKDFVAGLRDVKITSNTFIIVATRGHKYDDIALLEAARTPARYVGLVGSKRKALLIYRTLLAEGIPIERVRDIHSPIGLNLGGRTPEEIALSIMAEIEMVRLGGDGAQMKMEEKLIQKARQKAGIPA